MERELTLATIVHPPFIDNEWSIVDHPVVRPVQQGEPTLGWEGDPRLVVYLHKPSQTYVLWRLEHDGEYRAVAQLPSGVGITPASINKMIRRLVEIDQRRGFDPFADVIAQQDVLDRHRETDRQAASAQFADKFHFALARTHLPGIDIAKRVFPLNGG